MLPAILSGSRFLFPKHSRVRPAPRTRDSWRSPPESIPWDGSLVRSWSCGVASASSNLSAGGCLTPRPTNCCRGTTHPAGQSQIMWDPGL